MLSVLMSIRMSRINLFRGHMMQGCTLAMQLLSALKLRHPESAQRGTPVGVAGSDQPKAVPVMLDCIVEALPACLKCPVPGMGSLVGLGQPTATVRPPAAAWKADAPMHLSKGPKL